LHGIAERITLSSIGGGDLGARLLPRLPPGIACSLPGLYPYYKRVGHAAMEVFLVLNGREIKAGVDEQEHIILFIASGQLNRAEFEQWLSVVTGLSRFPIGKNQLSIDKR